MGERKEGEGRERRQKKGYEGKKGKWKEKGKMKSEYTKAGKKAKNRYEKLKD